MKKFKKVREWFSESLMCFGPSKSLLLIKYCCEPFSFRYSLFHFRQWSDTQKLSFGTICSHSDCIDSVSILWWLYWFNFNPVFIVLILFHCTIDSPGPQSQCWHCWCGTHRRVLAYSPFQILKWESFIKMKNKNTFVKSLLKSTVWKYEPY